MSIDKLVSRLPKEDFEKVTKLVKYKYDKKYDMSRHDYIVNTIRKTFKVYRRYKIEFELNSFFIDSIEIFMKQIIDNKISDNVDVERAKLILKTIIEYRCPLKNEKKLSCKQCYETTDINNKGKIQESCICIDKRKRDVEKEFCVNIVTRLPLIFNNHKENMYNCYDVEEYIVENSDKINKTILKNINKSLKILMDEVNKEERKSRIRAGNYVSIFNRLKNINKVTVTNEGNRFLNICKDIGCLSNQYIFMLFNTEKCYEIMLEDKNYIIIFEIALIIYQNEYKIMLLERDNNGESI